MPADQGKGPGYWHPEADFRKDYHLSAVITEQAVEFDDESQVAEQLRFTDPGIACYEFMRPEEELEHMALESARALIARRRALYDRRQAAVAPLPEKRPVETIVIAMVTRDGKTVGEACTPYAPKRRFG